MASMSDEFGFNNMNNYLLNKRVSLPEYPIRPIVKPNKHQMRHAPHPQNVRNERGFLGLPVQRVTTEDDMEYENVKKPYLPPSKMSIRQYIDYCHKNNNWQFEKPKPSRKTHDLDSIFAMQYFTGLKNFSFKENYMPYIGYRDYYDNWRFKLRDLTEKAYIPIKDTNETSKAGAEIANQNPYEWLNRTQTGKTPSSPTKMQQMYSSTGRLKTSHCGSSRGSIQSSTASKHPGLNTARSNGSCSNSKSSNKIDLNSIDADIFILLSDLLQTDSPLAVQKWLCQASDREKALIISMIQTALDKDKIDTQYQTHLEQGTQTSDCDDLIDITKPNIHICPSQMSKIPEEKSSANEVNLLIIEPDDQECGENKSNKTKSDKSEKSIKSGKSKQVRLPTSSTFKSTKNHPKSSTNAEPMWKQENSLG